MALVNNGQEYQGPAPYILVGVDGREEPQLEGFVPHVASAALLEKFYPKEEDGGMVLIDQLETAVTLLNDYKYRERAQKLKRRLSGMNEGDPQFADTVINDTPVKDFLINVGEQYPAGKF